MYGHVVGANPHDQAYVVPISATKEQIRKALRATKLGLPLLPLCLLHDGNFQKPRPTTSNSAELGPLENFSKYIDGACDSDTGGLDISNADTTVTLTPRPCLLDEIGFQESRATTSNSAELKEPPDFKKRVNKLPPEETELVMKPLEKRADETIRQTWIEGQPAQEVHEGAVTLRVGLTFMPGADKPQANRLEQEDMAGRDPDQKDALWRVHTAGLLLSTYEVSHDLSVVQRDQTAQIAIRARDRLLRQSAGNFVPTNQMKLLQVRDRDYKAVNIDSSEVYIVNDLRDRREEWDIESTLIEVDGSSLVGLMVNYRSLVHRGGPDMSFDETKDLLETMIEDARRLCVRSPILFQMSTRSRIINSKNTRYGVDNGCYFQTLTTSKDIKETISLSASYYNLLDALGTNDATQKFIRPRFLQMVTLLLSLLNDDDLLDISEFLETTYRFRAERKHLELLFLKVIPFVSINWEVFFKAMIPAYREFPMTEYFYSCYWKTFIQQIVNQGYLLPGTVSGLGSKTQSWIVQWPKIGFKSSVVFNNLQYSGPRNRTFNDILPIELHPASCLKELTVIMNNQEEFTIDSLDLERITCSKFKYTYKFIYINYFSEPGDIQCTASSPEWSILCP